MGSLLSYSTKMFTFNVSAKILQFSSNKCIRFANNRFNSSSSSKFVYSKWSQTRLPTIYSVLALGVFVGGFSYAAVPLYRIFCQSYSYGGTTSATGHKTEGLENMKPNRERVLRIRFNADTSS